MRWGDRRYRCQHPGICQGLKLDGLQCAITWGESSHNDHRAYDRQSLNDRIVLQSHDQPADYPESFTNFLKLPAEVQFRLLSSIQHLPNLALAFQAVLDAHLLTRHRV
jgi:hypothetical protein